MDVHLLNNTEQAQAVALVWEVFLEFEAPEYAPEGVEEFRRFLDSEEELKKLRWWGAIDNGGIVGVLAMRGPHISLFFVRKAVQGQGIGKDLFHRMAASTPATSFTVNSSPYAVGIYRRLGFVPTNREQVTNGIRYTPMVYRHSGKPA